MILVTTPTGDIGERVARALVDAGIPVRVLARDPARLAEDVRDRVEVVQGSHADASVIGPALDGVDAVFWLPPGSPGSPGPEAAYVAFSRAFCDALPSSAVARAVGVSALGRGWPRPAGHVTASVAMDDMIAATGVAYRALACASLMDNLLRQAGSIREQGVFYGPMPGDLALPQVAKSDVADEAVRLLTASDWTDAADVPMRGPEDLTGDQMAGIVSDVLSKPVAYQAVPMDAFADTLRAVGTSDGMVRAYVQMMTAKNEGMDDGPPGEARGGTTFRQWCEAELRPALAA